MTDAPPEAESEHRLPTAYSHGYAHVRVVAIANPYDTGPLALYPSPVVETETIEGTAGNPAPEKSAVG